VEKYFKLKDSIGKLIEFFDYFKDSRIVKMNEKKEKNSLENDSVHVVLLNFPLVYIF
jgi:hypothetical protein